MGTKVDEKEIIFAIELHLLSVLLPNGEIISDFNRTNAKKYYINSIFLLKRQKVSTCC